LGQIDASPGDSLILCSDGLTNMVDCEDITELCSKLGVEELVHQLIDSANQNGGVDNSTVVCVRLN